MFKHEISLVGGSDNETAIIIEDTINRRYRLTCEYRGVSIQATALDFFEAFCGIRLELEKEGLIPFCYGASLNVYPSGMCRDMGAGSVAYKLEMGKPVSMESLVEIFDDGDDITPATVARQKEYFNEWLASGRV